MMHFTGGTVVILLALVMSTWYSPSIKKYRETKRRIQQLQHEKHELNSTWPSFINDSSYIYLLGLFIEQRIPISKHLQTSAEPAMFRAAILLSQKYNITVNGKQFAYRIEDTNGRDVIETLDRTCLAISENHVLGIVGPEYSNEAKTIARFANRAGLPVIGYSTTDPELSNRNAYQTFYRLPPSDVITAQALLKLYQKYNWNSTNVIYQSDNYGESGLKALTEVFINEIQISRAIKYDLFTDRIDNFQRQLEESSSRIVLVWANANTTRKIIELALRVGNIMAPSLLWILIAPNSTMQIADNQNVNQLAGMLIVRLVTPNLFNIPTNTELLKNATAIWKEYDPESYPDDETQIDIFALYAFDATWLLILAIEKLCQQNPSTCLSLLNTSYCFASQLSNGNELNKIIQSMRFMGVSGRVQFQSNTTNRIDGTGAYYIIDNVQPSTMDIHKLQVVEVLKLNGTTMNNRRKSAPQWMESVHAIQWPSKSPEPPRDYALLKGKLDRV
jgi:ABC-type branched-subunit amino acid transport system substrate-binding protein